MKAQIYEAFVIKPGLARVSLSLFDNEDVFQGEYELTIEVMEGDDLEALKDKLIELLNLSMYTPKVVYELAGWEFIFEPRENKTVDILPDYKKAQAE